MGVEKNILVGGEAGQGVQTVGYVIAKTFSRSGFHVFADQDYESRVRGGHNFFRVRAAEKEVGAVKEEVDILVALDRQTLTLHQSEVGKNGLIVFDEVFTGELKSNGTLLPIPLKKLMSGIATSALSVNSAAIGAVMAASGLEIERLNQVLREQFKGSGADTVEANLKTAEAGYRYVREYHPGILPAPLKLPDTEKQMLLNGNEAIALGAMAADLKFVASYPMTPSSSISEYIAGKGQEYGVVVIQPEDEIAAINMAIGASYAGARAMTATSGGGFCLMVEGLSLAGMTETPLVVVLGQRPGPAIGLPTRTEQGELLFAINAGHGEFPRAVIAPTGIEDAFYITAKAFNLAEKYQVPVILLTDHHLASSYQTVTPFNLKSVTIEIGPLPPSEELEGLSKYLRHRYTKSGVSPRAWPMQRKALVVTDSDEHDEAGHMIEDAETRSLMTQKRLRKMEGISKEMPEPVFNPKPGAELTLVGWGSTSGALREAAVILGKDGLNANVIQLGGIWPFPAAEVAEKLKTSKKTLVVENNATAQLARLIRMETGIKADGSILKYDGRPFSPGEIVRQVEKEVR